MNILEVLESELKILDLYLLVIGSLLKFPLSPTPTPKCNIEVQEQHSKNSIKQLR